MILVANEAKMILLGEAESNELASFEVWDFENSIFEKWVYRLPIKNG